jgi:hypothetical protein
MKLPKTEIMMMAAAAMILALEARPERTACRGGSAAAWCWATWLTRKTS